MLNFGKLIGSKAVGALSSLGSSIISTATTAFPALLSSLGGAIASAWSFTAALLANPITWVVAGVVALGGALVALWKNWDSVTNWISDKWNSFLDLIKTGTNWVKDKLSNLFANFPSFPDIVGKIKNKLTAAADFIKQNPLKVVRFLVPIINLPDILNKMYAKARKWLAAHTGIELPTFKLPTLPDIVGKLKVG